MASSFIDKIGKTISNTANTVVEKTKSSTDVIRYNGLINNEEKTIEEMYRNIGKKYAQLHAADAEPEYEEFFQKITESQRRIAEYREQIRKSKHLLICQSCGTEIPETVLFCTKCGAENPVGQQLAADAAAREAEEKARQAAQAAATAQATQNAQSVARCSKCGKVKEPGAKFCTGCGTPFEPTVTNTPTEETVVETTATPVTPEAPATPAEPIVPETPVAPAEPVSPEVPETPETPVETQEDTVESAPTEAPKEETPETVCCPACHATVPANKFCTHCGAALTEE